MSSNDPGFFVYTCLECDALVGDAMTHSVQKGHLKGFTYRRVPLTEAK